jgi:hypothetical protein
MVWIHGGRFHTGSGNTNLHGPDHLMSEDILLVTINYRLGALGQFKTIYYTGPAKWLGYMQCFGSKVYSRLHDVTILVIYIYIHVYQ